MFAEVVTIQQMLSHACARRVECGCVVSHARDSLQDNGVVCGVGGRDAPAERGVAGDEYCRNRERIEWSITLGKAPYDGVAGVQHIVATHLIGGQFLGDGNGAIKVVGVRSSVRW